MGVLDWWKVEEMRERWEGGETQSSLSVRFGVSLNTVGKVVKGQSWTRQPPARVAGRGQGRVMGDPEGILQRVLAVQAERERRLGEAVTVPLSRMDGGEGEGGDGSGLARLQQVGKEMKDEGTL